MRAKEVVVIDGERNVEKMKQRQGQIYKALGGTMWKMIPGGGRGI